MTGHRPRAVPDEFESEAEVQAALESLLRAAAESGVDPIGSWDIRTEGPLPDWEVMILELAPED
ncbi:MAG: hypothetical protein ABEJ84_05455 [Halodesulfurarchaeum sp.]